MVPPGWMGIDNFETPAGTLKVWDWVEEVESSTVAGEVARTTAQTLS